MATDNVDVARKKANGTAAWLDKVVPKEGITDDDLDLICIDGRCVRSVTVDKAEALRLRLENGDFIAAEAKTESIRIDFPFELIPGKVKRWRKSAKLTAFPVLVNHATTGHKLQGLSKDSLFVHAWSHTKNWPCAILLRVRSLKGSFLGQKLDGTKDFANDSRMTRMLNRFRGRKSPHDLSDC